MKICIQLDVYDITNIIAEYFGVDSEKVKVEPYIGISGYGMAETETAFVRAEVNGDIGAMNFHRLSKDNTPSDNYGCYT